jgi:F-type H+-transporting ATPase subunit epsilon
MRLEVITPTRVCLDREVVRIRAEAPDGQFGILPQHIDFVSELVPGILVYEAEGAAERFVAVNSGMLVKCGPHVRVAVRGAIDGDDLAELRRRVEVEFRQQNDEDRVARSALARLEATMIRRFRTLEGLGR